MNRNIFLLFAIILPLHIFCQDTLKLWYSKPANSWTEALPVGNGRLGAMIFGGVYNELIQLNEATLWSGGPVRTQVNPGAYDHLVLARKELLEKEDYARAYEYTRGIQGYYSESYLPLADLNIKQSYGDSAVTEYYRDLDISNAISTTRFTIGATEYERQIISSAPAQLIVIHFTASKKGQLHFIIGLQTLLKHAPVSFAGNTLILRGNAPSHVDPDYVRSENPVTYDSTGCRGMRYELLVNATSTDGNIITDSNFIRVDSATEATIFISAATSFNGFEKCPVSEGKDEKLLANQYLLNSVEKSWHSLLLQHQNDYRKFFNRLSFHLNSVSHKPDNMPTGQRMASYTLGEKDPGFESLYFQYGRYLLISCSRTSAVPANLQGIWNKELRPPWSSNYTTNINVEMNYWAAEAANLSEMHVPFLEFIKNASVTGTVTAKEFYHARGWVVHHNSDIWALSNPVGDIGHGDPTWANWSMGSPWLSQHLWWHYQFTMNKSYLRQIAYPLMKGAAQFCMDWLVMYKKHLVTAPSVSPENSFIDDQGKSASVSIASTMDMAIIWDLFTNTIEASGQLHTDKSFRDLLLKKRKLLWPLQIGRKGNLQEWYKDWEDTDPHHRHVSQLFTLFPGQEISPIRTPAFAAAARKTLELRGDAGTGWSLAWKINFWARLLDGNHAHRMLHDLLSLTGSAGINYAGGGGSYLNLFDAHPPFQIDGNFGGLSGMIEMLLQSQNNEIYLLPALPDAWAEGDISGLKARGNFEIGMTWRNKKIIKGYILSLAGGLCRIRTNEAILVTGVAIHSVKKEKGYLTFFRTKKGVRYEIRSMRSAMTILTNNR